MVKRAFALAGILALFVCHVFPQSSFQSYLVEAILAQDERRLDNFLLSRMTNVNEPFNGATPLMVACENGGWRRGVQMLLDYGANPNARGANGKTALLIALQTTPDEQIISLLLSRGADVNARDSSGNTVLMYAVQRNGNSRLIDLLTRQPSFSPNAVNASGETALIIAIRSQNNDAIRKLLAQSGINVTQRTVSGEDAMTIALQNNDIDTVKVLLQNKAIRQSLNKPDGDGNTYLVYAIETENREIVRLFLREDIDPRVRVTDDALPVLLWAISEEKSPGIIQDIIQSLKRGQINDLFDREGRNAWDYAASQRNVAVLRMLEMAGIDKAR